MSNLNQFFPSSGGGRSTPTLIPAEIVVVGGGAWGFYCLLSGCKCFAVPGPPPYSFTHCVSGNGGAAIHAQNFMLSPGSTCPIQVGFAATDANPSDWSCVNSSPVCTKNFTVYGFTGAGGTSYFGGTSVLCAEGSCSQGVPLKPVAPYAPPTYGVVNVRAGCTNVSSGQLYDLSIKTGVIQTDILGSVCIFGNNGAGGYSATPAGCNGGNICLIPAEQICIIYGADNSGGGSSAFVNLQPTHPGFPDANIPICRKTKNGTVIVKYPNAFPASPSFPGACDCSPQTPGYHTYRFVSPGSITLP